ncbi:23S rRNA (guanosine(2251)-2'-O)-methyltransferase RlmB [Calditerricola yamamurae]
MTEWIYGRHPVLEALRAGRAINKILLAEGVSSRQLAPLLTAARQQGVPVQQVPRRKLDELAPAAVHQGVAAAVAARAYAEVTDLLARARARGEMPFLVVLDGLEDPHNLGSILRTADAVGAHGVIIPKRRSAQLTPAAVKASAGAAEHVPVARVTNIARTLEELKAEGLWVVGTDAQATHDYRTADYTVPLALVVGSEGRGMSRLVLETCDVLVRLPMVGRLTSLNAAVAAALLMYEVFRARHPVG